MSGPFLIWPNMAVACEPDLRWLVENHAAIVAAWRARPMRVPRPIKVWPNGRVRIEFCGTWGSFAQARRECEEMVGPDRVVVVKDGDVAGGGQ